MCRGNTYLGGTGMENTSDTNLIVCSKSCPTHCCYDTPTEAQLITLEQCNTATLKVEKEELLRLRALEYSNLLVLFLVSAHIYVFITTGKVLPIPDILYALAAAPWLGAGAGKLVEHVTSMVKK